MPSRVRLTVPSDERSLPIVSAVVAQFGAAVGLTPEVDVALDGATQALVRFVFAQAYPGEVTGEVELVFECEAGAIRVTLQDWGEPIPSFGGAGRPVPAELTEVDLQVDDLRLVNLGSEGKLLTALLPAPAVVAADPTGHAFGVPPASAPATTTATADEIEIRPVADDEVAAVSRLLYSNYGLSYGHPDFYRPDWFAEQLAEGRVLSTVAVFEGEVVGHHALLREEDETAGETGVAVVHSAYRGLGVFGRLFAHTVERAQAQGLDAVFGRAVTVHPFSQRAERAHGYRETALLLGAVPASMAMRGIGDADVEVARRSATLVTYHALGATGPRAVTLPARYADPLRAAYALLGLEVAPVGAFADADDGPEIVARDDRGRATGVLLVRRWRPGAGRRLVHEIREMNRRHEDVVYVDLDLHALDAPALDEALAVLHDRGFFYAGLMPFGPEGHDRLRLQRIQAENVELERIVLDSADAQALHAAVMADRDAVEDD